METLQMQQGPYIAPNTCAKKDANNTCGFTVSFFKMPDVAIFERAD
jgi:hypothetical protein